MEIIFATITSFFISFSAFLFLHTTNAAAAADPPPRPWLHLGCVEQLVLFSPCLPYVSASPNNLTAEVTPQCCAVFRAAIDTGGGNCLCYLRRQPLILGFPLDGDKVVSLPRLCTDGSNEFSLETLCSPSASPELPPLEPIDGERTGPLDSGDDISNSSSISLPPESNPEGSSPEPAARLTPPVPPHSGSTKKPERNSSESNRTHTRLGWLTFITLLSALINICK